MKELQAYECADGSLFTDEDRARAHDEDLLGQELDGLLKLFAFNGNQLTRVDEYRALTQLMKRKTELRASIGAILRILDHGRD